MCSGCRPALPRERCKKRARSVAGALPSSRERGTSSAMPCSCSSACVATR
jgi:hypothetical protein